MPAAAIIGGVASIGGALIGGSAAKSAANTQADAARYAADMQMKQYEQTRTDLTPWRTAGAGALGTLTGKLSDLTSAPTGFKEDPGYQFARSEGMRALDGSAASKGMLMSGGTLKDAMRFSTGLADQQYGDWWAREMAMKDSTYNKLSGVATMGQNAATQTGQMGQNAAASAGNYVTQGANASAAGTIGQANAITGGLGNLATLAMNNLGGGGGSTYARLLPSVNTNIAANPSIF